MNWWESSSVAGIMGAWVELETVTWLSPSDMRYICELHSALDVPHRLTSSWVSKTKYLSKNNEKLAIPKSCLGIVDIQEEVFSKFQAFLCSFAPVMDKTVLGCQGPDYVQ